MSLIGKPGSGKTTTLINYVVQKYNQKLLACDSFRLISFSNKQVDDIINRYIQTFQKQKPQIISKKNTKTFHKFACEILGTKSKSINTVIDETVKCLQHGLYKTNVISKLSLIIIDEAQDMSDLQFQMVCLIQQKVKDLCIILIGDPNQSIYQFQGGNENILLNYFKETQQQLMINYRSTLNIVDVCNRIMPWKEMHQIANNDQKGDCISVIQTPSIEEQIQDILSYIQQLVQNGVSLSDIAIIGPIRVAKKKQGQKYIGLNNIADIIQEQGFPLRLFYNIETDSNEMNEQMKIQYDSDAINILTIHASKGLEFDHVIAIDQKKYDVWSCKIQQYLYYVQMSRAKKSLRVYTSSLFYNFDNKDLFPEIDCKYTQKYQLPQDLIHNKPLAYSPSTLLGKCDRYNNEYCVYNKNQIYNKLHDELLCNLSHSQTKLFDICISEEHLSILKKYPCFNGKFFENLFYFYQKQENNEYIDILQENFPVVVLNYNQMHYAIKYFVQIGIVQENLDKTYNAEAVLIGDYSINDKYMEQQKQLNEILHGTSYKFILQNQEELEKALELKHSVKNIKTEHDLFQYTKQLWYLTIKFMPEDFDDYFDVAQKYFDFIKHIPNIDISSIQKYIQHPNFNIYGYIDGMIGNVVIDLKFKNQITDDDLFQVLMYQESIVSHDKQFKILNLQTGILHTYKYNMNDMQCNVLYFINDITEMKIKDYDLIFDTETSGLGNTDQIIDICFIDKQYGFKFYEQLIYYPDLSDEITTLTGITQELLDQKGISLQELRSDMQQFFEKFTGLRLHAHNVHFDKQKLQHNIGYEYMPYALFIDTAPHFKKRINGVEDNKLSTFYKQEINQDYQQTHRAYDDAYMIYQLYKKLESKTYDEFNSKDALIIQAYNDGVETMINPYTNRQIQTGSAMFKKLYKEACKTLQIEEQNHDDVIIQARDQGLQYILNPYTGKKIKTTGTVFKKLLQEALKNKQSVQL